MTKDNRPKCPHCGMQGWNGAAYKPHDKPTGGPCRPSGALTEREIKAALDRDAPKVKAAASAGFTVFRVTSYGGEAPRFGANVLSR